MMWRTNPEPQSGPVADAGSWGPSSMADQTTGAPAPGSLKIKERRAWRTWHVVLVGVVAALVGMVIGNSGGGGTASSQPNTPTYTLPVPSGSTQSPSSTTPTSSAPGTSSSTTTSAPQSAPSTSSPATSPGDVGLGAGSARPNPGDNGQLDEHVRSPSPAVSGTLAGRTNALRHQHQVPPFRSSCSRRAQVRARARPCRARRHRVNPSPLWARSGSQELEVKAPPSCVWKVKVTGVG